MNIDDLLRQFTQMRQEFKALQTRDKLYYVEGTFTPTYFGSTTSGVTTYTTQFGSYIRVGNRVDYTIYLNWTAATGTGNVLIGGFPFTTQNVTNQFQICVVGPSTVTFTGSGIYALIRPNTSQWELYTPASNAASTRIAIEAAGEITLCGVCYVA